MKSIKLFLFLTLLCNFNPMISNASEKVTTEKQSLNQLDNLDNRIISCKKIIMKLAHDNEKVQKQLNLLMDNLQYLKNNNKLLEADVNNVLDSLMFAAEKHEFQTRKNIEKTPYIVHPIGVANNLITIGLVSDPDTIIAALLHDTVEDTDTSFEEIEMTFGPHVLSIVKELTDDKDLPKQKRKELQIEHAAHKSKEAAQVKLCDKLYNLTDLKNAPPATWDQERIDHYFIWAESVTNNLPQSNTQLKKAVDELIKNFWSEKENHIAPSK